MTLRNLLIFVFGCFFLGSSAFALDAQVYKQSAPNGDLQAVVLVTPTVIFIISPYGQLLKASLNHQQVPDAVQQAAGMPAQDSSTSLQISRYPTNAPDGNGGKIAVINDIHILYYPCGGAYNPRQQNQLSSQFIAAIQQQNGSGTASSNNNVDVVQLRLCGGLSQPGGKIQQIGDIPFQYGAAMNLAFNPNTRVDDPFSNNRGGMITTVNGIPVTSMDDLPQ